MSTYQLELFADYFQFYLQDECVSGDLSDAWTREATDRKLAVAPGTIGVSTARNMNVPVSIEILDSEPVLELDPWDHVNECALEVTSGRIVVAGCTESLEEGTRIELPPASYRARVSYGKQGCLSSDGLSGDDHYLVQLWPAPFRDVIIVK